MPRPRAMFTIKDDFEPIPNAEVLRAGEIRRRALMAAQSCARAVLTLGEQMAASAQAIEKCFDPELLKRLEKALK